MFGEQDRIPLDAEHVSWSRREVNHVLQFKPTLASSHG